MTATGNYPEIRAAVQALAGVCDYAHELDGQGFNASDTALGHRTAQLPPDQWTPQTAQAAWHMLRKYARQLDGLGHPHEDLPVPDGAEALTEEQRAELREQLLEQGREYRRRQAADKAVKEESYVLCEGEGETVILFAQAKTPAGFNWDIVNETKAITGRAFRSEHQGHRNVNLYPFSSLGKVIDFCDRHAITVADELRGLAVIADRRAAEEAAALAARGEVFLDERGRLTIDAPWRDNTPALNDALRAYNRGYSTWDKKDKVHRPRVRDAAELLALLETYGLNISQGVRDHLAAIQAEQERNRRDSVALTGAPLDIPGLALDVQLKDVQYPAVRYAIKHRGVFIGDEMGWGKSLSALSAVAVDGAYPAVVACRPSLILNWVREAERFPTLRVHVATGTVPTPIPDGTDLVIIGTAALGTVRKPPTMTPAENRMATRRPRQTVGIARTRQAVRYLLDHPAHGSVASVSRAASGYLKEAEVAALAREDDGRVRLDKVRRAAEYNLVRVAAAAHRTHPVFPWVPVLEAIKPKALILDEGQDAKEQTANRSQALERLAKPIIKRDGLRLDLTGTMIVNRPREAGHQLAIIGRIDEFGGMGAFLVRHCEDIEKSSERGRNFTGAHHLDELYDTLTSRGIMVRRTDYRALGLPEFTERPVVIGEVDLDPKVMAEYRQAEADVIEYLSQQARKIAKRKGVDPESEAVRAAMKAESAEHLVRLNALRKLIGSAKIEAAARLVADYNTQGEKVMIAAHHREVVTALAKRFGGLKIQGGQKVESVEADKARFQTEPVQQAPAITVSITAGGVGHTLTAARIGVQVEMPWTPGDKNQMGKRMHRIGQDRPVEYLVLLAQGTVDDYMWDTVTGKQAILDAVLDGKASEGVDESENDAVADVAWQLAQRGLRP